MCSGREKAELKKFLISLSTNIADSLLTKLPQMTFYPPKHYLLKGSEDKWYKYFCKYLSHHSNNTSLNT